jgi:predicted small integral membrane protein
MARKKAVKKEVVEKISAIKKTINAVKAWLEGNGIEGILGLIVGLLLWSFGFKIYAGFAFGVFATRNWDLAKAWVLKLINK